VKNQALWDVSTSNSYRRFEESWWPYPRN
jgi:hypothetical protein